MFSIVKSYLHLYRHLFTDSGLSKHIFKKFKNCNFQKIFMEDFPIQTCVFLPLQIWAGTRVATALAQGLLNCDEERKFWINWNNNQLSIGSGNIAASLTVRQDLWSIHTCDLLGVNKHKKWVHNPLLNFSVHTKVDQIASVNVPTTNYLANSSYNSSRLINHRYE